MIAAQTPCLPRGPAAVREPDENVIENGSTHRRQQALPSPQAQINERRGDEPERQPAQQRIVSAQRRKKQTRHDAGGQPDPKQTFDRVRAPDGTRQRRHGHLHRCDARILARRHLTD
ncbi:MAG: hypothetical protein ACYC9P_02790 [Rudaea sp.]